MPTDSEQGIPSRGLPPPLRDWRPPTRAHPAADPGVHDTPFPLPPHAGGTPSTRSRGRQGAMERVRVALLYGGTDSMRTRLMIRSFLRNPFCENGIHAHEVDEVIKMEG